MSLPFCYVIARKALTRVSLTSFVVLGALALPLIGAQPKRTFTVEADIETSDVWREFPRWNAGQLVGVHSNRSDAPVIYTVDRDGRRDEYLFTISDAKGIHINDVAITPDGEIGLVGGAYGVEGRYTTFVARIAPDRKSQTVTRTWPYCPIVVTIAADGSIWTIGRLKNEEGTEDLAEAVLRTYGEKGTALQSGRINIQRPLRRTIEVSYLFSSRDRVGWLTTGGEYIEFSLDGKEIGRYKGPEGSDRGIGGGVAMSEDNDVVAGNFDNGKAEFVVLDRSSGEWVPGSFEKEQAPRWVRVLGFDGTTLVTTPANGRLRRFKTK